MSIYKPTALFPFLESLGAGAKKSLSQNFLVDGNILRKIVKEAEVQPGDFVLEIGSGPGALTECLLAAGAQVVAVEKDTLFARALNRFSNVQVHEADILEFPLDLYFSKEKKTKVVANLPYHLTSPILDLLVKRHDLFSTLTLMVQEEVARRIVAKPGHADYSSLSLFLNFYSTPRYCFGVSNQSFYPVPKVQSAIIQLHLQDEAKLSPVHVNDFFQMVRSAFSQRRKMLRSSLRNLFPQSKIEEVLQKLDIAPTVRPENLSLEQFLSFYSGIIG